MSDLQAMWTVEGWPRRTACNSTPSLVCAVLVRLDAVNTLHGSKSLHKSVGLVDVSRVQSRYQRTVVKSKGRVHVLSNA